MKTVSFASLVTEYRETKLKDELVGDWGSVVFYRLPAFAVVCAVAPLGVTANQLTLAGALLVPLMALAAWFLAPGPALLAVVVLSLVFNVLDCADGPLARATGSSSLAGRYLDFAADLMYRNVAYACYGLIADRAFPGAAFPWLAVGLCCGVLVTYARLNRVYAETLMPPSDDAAPAPAQQRSAFDIGFSVLSGIDTLLPLVALFAWEAGVMRAGMLWFLLYTLGDAAIEFLGNLAKTRRVDSGLKG